MPGPHYLSREKSTACFGSYVWDGGAQYSINFATRKLFV